MDKLRKLLGKAWGSSLPYENLFLENNPVLKRRFDFYLVKCFARNENLSVITNVYYKVKLYIKAVVLLYFMHSRKNPTEAKYITTEDFCKALNTYMRPDYYLQEGMERFSEIFDYAVKFYDYHLPIEDPRDIFDKIW